MTRTRMTWLTATLCLVHSLLAAQNDLREPPERVSALLAFQVGIPTKKMQPAVRNNMGNMGFGGSLAVLTNPFTWGRNKKNSPLRIGGELGYTYYGRFLTDVTINGYDGSYKTSYGILHANVVLRLLPSQPSNIRPFVEALFGGNFYLSSIRENLSVIESALGIEGFDLDSYNSAGLNKGIAVGCGFGKKRDAMFTVRVSYNWGTDIKYIVRNSLIYNGSTLQYSVGRAPVNYVIVQIGIGI